MIEVTSLTVRFGGVTSLDGLSVAFERGTCGLIGPNGAGKTTFFNVLSGFVRPSAGTVLAYGEDLLAMAAYRRARWGVRRTFQTEQAIAGLSVFDNLALVHEHSGLSRASRRRDVLGAISFVGHLRPVPRGGAVSAAAGAGAVPRDVQAALGPGPGAVRWRAADGRAGAGPRLRAALHADRRALAGAGAGDRQPPGAGHPGGRRIRDRGPADRAVRDRRPGARPERPHHGGRLRYSGLASELREKPELLRSAYLLRGSGGAVSG